MPHFVIEYSRDVETRYDMAEVMEIAFASGVETGVMQGKDIKIRARPYDHYRMPDKDDSFLHVTVFLLAGRTDAQKEKVSLALRAALAGHLKTVSSVSVDIRDMNTTVYKKRLL